MKLTAEQANMLHEIFNADIDKGMKEIYTEILNQISKAAKHLEMAYITNDEAKLLLDAGYKIYSIDGAEQYTRPIGFDYAREVRIEW